MFVSKRGICHECKRVYIKWSHTVAIDHHIIIIIIHIQIPYSQEEV